MSKSEEIIAAGERYSAGNYKPLPVVLERGEGVFVYDVEGRRYYDMLSAYSAVNQGHQHPRIVAAMVDQLERLALTSRAFHNDKLGPFLELLCAVSGMDKALPMNSGAEAVETAIKMARRYGYRHKGIAKDRAEIIVCDENFHGRTTTIVGFSTDSDARDDFGPMTPGFVSVPYGDSEALEAAITENTAAFLVEPVQGEAGVIIPPVGYLARCREVCSRRGVLLICDEIQTGLGRTGAMFCFEHDEVRPDILVVGKALSGGLYPVSAALSSEQIMAVFTPGSHGSTYGGNPLASAVGKAALEVLIDESLPERAAAMGARFIAALGPLERSGEVKEIRGRGLLVAIEFHEPIAKQKVKKLMLEGVLAKDTHGSTIRFAPPLVIGEREVDDAAARICRALSVEPAARQG